MARTIVTRNINAPVELVFRTIADINQFSKAVPHIVKVEFLSDIKLGVGARFRETILMKEKETTTELQVTEYDENNRIRLVAIDHGIVWDTVFVVKREINYTNLTLTMDAITQRPIAKIMIFFITGMVKKAIERDLDGVKAFCER